MPKSRHFNLGSVEEGEVEEKKRDEVERGWSRRPVDESGVAPASWVAGKWGNSLPARLPLPTATGSFYREYPPRTLRLYSTQLFWEHPSKPNRDYSLTGYDPVPCSLHAQRLTENHHRYLSARTDR